MVDFVEDDKPTLRQPKKRLRGAAALLIGRDNAVGVSGQQISRRPVNDQMEAEAGRSVCPLLFQVAGRSHNNETARQVRKRQPGGGQSKSGLACTRRGNGQKVRLV